MNVNKRIENIAYRSLADDEKYAAEILCYYPNFYYGEENNTKKFIKDEFNPEYYVDLEYGCRVHEGCFKHPESCYVVAFVTRGEEPDIVSVGDRPWTLNEENKKSFEKLLELFFKYGEDFGDSYGQEE